MRRFHVALFVSSAVLFVASVTAAVTQPFDDEGDTAAVPTTVTTAPPSPTTTTAPAPTTTTGPPPGSGVFVVGKRGTPLLASPGGKRTGRIRAGVLLPYDDVEGGWARVTTPCERHAWAPLRRGRAQGPFRVAVDPGHGGVEPGAVGPTGLTEKQVNLDVSRRVVRLLGRQGIPAVLTRSQDYRATLTFRVELAEAAGAEVLVSVHHNAEPDERRRTPGTETYFQFRSPESKRLAGLVQEEVFTSLDRYDISFAADTDAGAKWRLGSSGSDYYAMVRQTFDKGITATLSEAAFMSNPAEERLLRRPAVRRAEARAIAAAVVRYFRGEEPGDVYTTPYPRTTPAGPGGGGGECVDPA